MAARAKYATRDNKPATTANGLPMGQARQSEVIPVLDLGLVPYQPVQDLQAELRVAVARGIIPGVVLLLEHEPVITLGTRAGVHDLRFSVDAPPRGITVVKSERGGQATL
ncbi:MAG: hypothetical protein H5T84_03955, partial [Thermoleophilia bacterium]|nr:hypothetical protein [Thermoleophilia bacterium]